MRKAGVLPMNALPLSGRSPRRTRGPQTEAPRGDAACGTNIKRPREPMYVSVRELVDLTPWSEQAIRTMIRRGTFKLDVHYFQPFGRRSRVIFKWPKVLELIEGKVATKAQIMIDCAPSKSVIPMPNGKVIDVQEATQAALRRLA
jgi:hypothetical protein